MRNIFSCLFLCAFIVRTFATDVIAISKLSASGGVTASEAVALTDALRSEIVRSKVVKNGTYEVMERAQMDEILKEQGFQQTGVCDEANCAVEMGRVLAVKFMLLGNVGKVGQTFTMNLRLVDVQTGKIIRDITEFHSGTTDDLLVKVVPIVAGKIMGTYVKRKSHAWIWLTTGCLVALAVPVTYFVIKSNNSTNTMSVGVTW
jgi:TolB-like protein